MKIDKIEISSGLKGKNVMTPILDITAQLVLPENFFVCKGYCVPLLHLVY